MYDLSQKSSQMMTQREGKKLMTDFQVFMSVCKGYCAINILVLPKNFENGGWIVGVVSMILAGLLIYVCARKLVQCAQKI